MLLAAGVTARHIRTRRETGRLIELHRHVYAVGHDAVNASARRLAAVWAYGEGAALSHRSAAAVWELRAWSGVEHVAVPTVAGVVQRAGTRVHRTHGTIERTLVGVLPVTTVARTCLDVAGDLSPRELEALLAHADRLGLFDLRALRAIVAQHPRSAGARPLREALDRGQRHGFALTLSELEVAMLTLCDAHRLPHPVANARLAGRRRDFHWPGTDLVVETDGWDTHGTRTAFEDDRRRDQELVLAGYRVIRVTHRQLRQEPARIAQALRALLA